ncbi:MAG: VWA domain-containing protein [Terriglobia bacterium]
MKSPASSKGNQRLVLFILLFALPTLGQKKPASIPSQGVLHVITQLVQVNVIVDDKHNHTIPGLTRDDFTIFDDGEPQKISVFKVEQSQPAAALVKLPPGIFSNMPERQTGASPAVTVILLDGLNTSWADQASARLSVIKYLKQLQPNDRVALYSLGRQLRVLHDFSSDSKALVQALSHFSGRAGSELDASLADDPDNPPQWSQDVSQGIGDSVEGSAAVSSLIQGWLNNATNAEAEYYMNQRVEMTVDALVAIAQHLQGVGGRKNLVWVSGAFPVLRGMDQMMQNGDFSTGSTYGEQVAHAAQALNDVNLAIYPVDARGLMLDPNYGPESLSVNQVRAKGMARVMQPKLPAHLTDNFPTMDEFAKRTGGRAFYNTNDIQGSIRRVIENTRLTYLLAYYPTNGKWNGEYHKIKVEVDRPALRLQYRDGYSALPEEPPASPAGKKALDAAILSPLDATAVACVVKPIALKTPPGQPPAVEMQYWVDARNITLTPAADGWQGSITLVAAEIGSRGESLKAVSHLISFHVTPAKREDFLASGVRFNELVPIVPNAERIRVVVRDDPTGTLGSLSVPIGRVLPPHGG